MSQLYNSAGDHAVTLSFSGTQSHTIMCWYYASSASDGGDCLTLWDGSYSNCSVIGFNGSGGITTFCSNGATNYTSAPATYATNTWQHFASVFDGANVISYLNGVQVDTHAFSLTARATLTQLQIGVGSSSRQHQDVMIFTSALSAQQVIGCMKSRVPLAARASLYGSWPLFNSSPLVDFSGNARTLSNNAGTPAAGTTWAPSVWAASPQKQRTMPPQYAVNSLPLAGPLTVASTLAGTLLQSVPLAGTETVASTLAATLSVPKNLAGADNVASTLAATLTQAQPLIGASTVASTFAGTLGVPKNLAGSDTIASTFAGTLTQAQPLLGSETVASTLAATLSQAQPLLGSSSVASTFAGTLLVAVALTGADTVASTLAGTLTQAQALAGSVTDASTLAGSLTVPKNLAGADAVASTFAATLTQSQPLVGSDSVASTLAGALSVTKPLDGSTTSASTLSGTLGITGLFQGGTFVATTLSGTLGVLRPIAGATTVASTLAATLTQAQPLAASSTVASTLAATLTVPKNLVGSASSASTLTGQLRQAQPLVGASAVASTLGGALTVPKPLAGASSAASTLSATLSTQNFLVGLLGVSSTLQGTISGGTEPIPMVWAGWSDAGDVTTLAAPHGAWFEDASGEGSSPAAHGAWASELDGSSGAAHGVWVEDPVPGGVVLHPELAVNLIATTRTASTLTAALTNASLQPSLYGTALTGAPFTVAKNWVFGTNGNINNAAALNAEFTYHDPFGTISNGTNYGALIQRAAGSDAFGVYNWADVGMANDQQPEDTTGRYRTFQSDSLLCHVKPLNTGSVIVGPASTHNAGCGSFVSKLTYSAGGTRLGQTIVWETRVRCVTAPDGYWFALWLVGPQWDGGPEIDLVESFSSVAPNVNADLFNSNGIGIGPNTYDYFSGGFDDVLETLGIPGYALPNGSQSLRNWHTFTLEYASDNTFRCWMDSILIQSGTLDWRLPSGPTVPTLQFLFDFGFGHTAISPINAAVISDITATPLTYEIAYSRIWTR
jgi:starvation-inducible outer membrane lipoprotein